MKPFINYFGGKYRCAPMYPKPTNNVIIEPFAGGAGYALRYHEHKVKLYEKYDDLYLMWEFLINASKDDILSLPLEFDSLDDISVSKGAKVMIGFLLNTGVTRPARQKSKWARENNEGGQFWGERRRNRIASQVSLIKHWEIYKINDYSEIENEKATWFIDPPYQKQGIHYVHGSKNIDFNQLGGWCKERKGQVIVCEQEGADWLEWNGIKKVKANDKTKTSNEVWYHAEQK